MLPELAEDRKTALRQWKALYQICCSQEKVIISKQKKIKELETELARTSFEELDGLYKTIEILTNRIEELEQ